MKNLKLAPIAIITLILSIQPVWSEQLKSLKLSSKNDEGYMGYSIDIDSIKKDGKFRMVWTIATRWEYTKNDEISWRTKEEFDCYGERVRTHEWFSYSDPYPKGKLINQYVGSPFRWERVRPESIQSKVLKIVCDK